MQGRVLPLNTVAEYISRVREICEMNPEKENPTFFVAGPVNAGKSTLINNLLEQRICPDDPSPSTLFPVYFGYAETPSASKTVKGRSIPLPDRELREVLRYRRRILAPDRAEVFLPASFLRWCSLVDMPGTGLSAETDGLIRNSLSSADGIVFIFHQRGIDAATYRFLTGLAAAGIKGWISFWINANLGLIDGTSLTETRQALRSVFPGRAEVYAINTRDPASTGLISLFLQVRAMESAVRGIETNLTRRDKMLPGLLERASMLEDDHRFLLKFWEVAEQAERINSGRQAVRDLPLIYGSMANMLQINTRRLTAEPAAAPALRKNSRAGPGAGEILSSLVREVESDRELAWYVDRGLLKGTAARLADKCRVMVAGPFSTGKTTFLNALLGETLLPAEDRATTSCAVRVGNGSEKTAAVEYLFRTEFYPISRQAGKYTLDRQEMLAITQILDSPPLRELVSDCQICRDGSYKSIPLSQLVEILEEICQSCGGDTDRERNSEKAPRVPLFSRMAKSRLIHSAAVTTIRFTLGGRDRLMFNLDDDRQRLEFYRAISPPGSFLVDSVTINHPSPNLAPADFIDTPGLDSLHKRHYDRALEIVSSGDLALVFLHAKHVLAEGVPGHINIIKNLALNIPVFYVINFADTVSDTDREKVSLYIRQKLGHDTGSGEIIPYPQVYAISALNALHGGDDGFDRLLRRVRKKTEEIESRKVTGAIREVKACLENISAPDPFKGLRVPDRARQAARHYLKELERLQKSYF